MRLLPLLTRIGSSGIFGAILALALLAAPAQAGRHSKPKTVVKDFAYSGNQGDKQKLVYHDEVVKVYAFCTPGEYPSHVLVKPRNGKVDLWQESVLSFEGAQGGGVGGGPGQSVGQTSFGKDGTQAFLAVKGNKVVTVDSITDEDIGSKDCFAAGTVVAASKKNTTTATARVNDTDFFDGKIQPGVILNCTPSDVSVTGNGNETPPPQIDVAAGDYFTINLTQRFYTPLTSPQTFLAANDYGAMGDVNYITGETNPSYARYQMVPSKNGGDCQGRGLVRTPTEKGPFFAGHSFATTGSGGPFRVYKKDGFEITQTCAPGSMKIYVSTTKPGGVLHASILGGSQPTLYTVDEFTNGPENPLFLLDFPNLQRAGQIVYASPKGVVTTFNWFGSIGAPDQIADCEFSGVGM